MDERKTHQVEVCAMLYLARPDCLRIKQFWQSRLGLSDDFFVPELHVSVYQARREMAGLKALKEPAKMVLYSDETRFMLMGPGGENSRPNLTPANCKVGIRIRKDSLAYSVIQDFRNRLLHFETPEVLGIRRPSTRTRNAFGSREFQPHMSLLKKGSGLDSDLTPLGVDFRNHFGCFKFDRFGISIRTVER